MVKCNVNKCEKNLSIEDKEVYTIQVVKKEFTTKKGKKIRLWDGWRFVCKKHYDKVKSGELKANLDLIYGKKKEV